MKLLRAGLALLVLMGLSGVAYVAQVSEPAGLRMANAADKFLATLNAEQKAKTVHQFGDKERLNWHFVPLQTESRKSTRKGLPLEEMTSEQKAAARELLKAGTSARGFVQATTIMSLEAILHELEKDGRMVRNPEWYFFTVFGAPSKTGKWGWRVEGHHLSLNFVVDGGRLVAATPAFFGANPAIVKGGERKGLSTLAEVEDSARDLVAALDEGQRKIAHQDKHFDEIAGQTPAPKFGEPMGLVAAKMTEKQQQLLLKLLRAYTDRLPAEVGEAEFADLRSAGIEKIHFAYSGEIASGKPHTYRIQGPTFLVELLNIQEDSARNAANHIHSAWRNVRGDFGVNN
jgi:hypothetical protein